MHGQYQATGELDITFPAGFTPTYQAIPGASRALFITCGPGIEVAPASQALDSDDSTLMTVTITATKA